VSHHIDIDWILLVVRIAVAIVMLYYGQRKIRNLRSNANDFVQMGFRPGIMWGTLIAIVEFFGGIALLIGSYAELAAALFAFQMMVGTFWKLKIRKPFSDYSYDILLFALCLVVMSQGAGLYSLRSFPGAIFLRWDVALASLAGASLLALSGRPRQNNSAETAAA